MGIVETKAWRQNDPSQPKEKLCYRYLFFQADFDGPREEYVDAFV